MHPGLVVFLTLLALGTATYWIYNNYFTRDAMKGRINKKHRNMLDEYKKIVVTQGSFKKEFRESSDMSEEKLDKLFRQASFLSQMLYFGNHVRGPMYGYFKLVKEDGYPDKCPDYYYNSDQSSIWWRAGYWYKRVYNHFIMEFGDQIDDEWREKVVRQCKLRYIRGLALLIKDPKMNPNELRRLMEDHSKFRMEPDMYGDWNGKPIWDPIADDERGSLDRPGQKKEPGEIDENQPKLE